MGDEYPVSGLGIGSGHRGGRLRLAGGLFGVLVAQSCGSPFRLNRGFGVNVLLVIGGRTGLLP